MSDSRAGDDPVDAKLLMGSCLCGGVRYRAEGPLTLVTRCHCLQCRKQSGAEFATNASLENDRFELLEGEALLRDFESSPGEKRIFCGQCGSSILKRSAASPDFVRLRLGCLDSDFDQKIQIRIFTESRLAISEFSDDIPSFETLPGAASSDPKSD
ncbi:MAG: GFA family protein [bacterium]|nr:aldehyde-activating protein [Deltaproteobacteria bacterium]MCP4903376.1 GFA family protein [bacterium]